MRVEVFSEQTEVTPADVVAFWLREGAMPEEVARRRVDDVLLVALGGDGTIAGVASAQLARNPRLHMPMWNFRAFVAAAQRRTGVVRRLGYAGRDLLRARFEAGDDRALGIAYELHSRELAHADPAEWEDVGFAFIGETERGHHVRVHYFPGAPAPPPPLQGSA